MKKYTFLLSLGYAEGAHTSYFPFTSKKKYAGVKEAFIDLANFLKEKFDEKNDSALKSCCNTALAVKAYYCCKCGNDLRRVNAEFDIDEFNIFLEDLSCSDTNGAVELLDYDPDARWQLEMPNSFADIKVVNTAEHCLAAALGHAYDDRYTIDVIFKNSRKNTFGYWM